jgi:hypothetical protein
MVTAEALQGKGHQLTNPVVWYRREYASAPRSRRPEPSESAYASRRKNDLFLGVAGFPPPTALACRASLAKGPRERWPARFTAPETGKTPPFCLLFPWRVRRLRAGQEFVSLQSRGRKRSARRFWSSATRPGFRQGPRTRCRSKRGKFGC